MPGLVPGGSGVQQAVVADVRAPEIVWGPATGTTGGELLRVQYVADEPIAQARLRLPDGRWLELAVAADDVSVLLPADTNEGWAGIEVRDAVGNVRFYSAVVLLQGLPMAPPVEPTGGMPRPSARPRPSAPETRSIVRRRGYALQVASQGTSKSLGYCEIPVRGYVASLESRHRLGTFVAVDRKCASRVDVKGQAAVAVGTSASRGRRDDEALVALLLAIPVVD